MDKAVSMAVCDMDGKDNISCSDKTDLPFCYDPLLGPPIWELPKGFSFIHLLVGVDFHLRRDANYYLVIEAIS